VRIPIPDEQKKLLELVGPYIVTMLPDIVYIEGTPEYIKEKHRELIDLAFQEMCNE
jgi:hypothetical protein